MSSSTGTLAVPQRRLGVLTKARDFVELTKPRIAVLVLVVVAASGIAATWGTANPWMLFHAAMGTLLVAGSASAANQWLERHRDARMNRTQDRPLPAGRLSVTEVLAFTVITLACGITYLMLTVGEIPTLWAVASWLLYVIAYTPLKPLSSVNTMVGAVAGALPVFIGWTATGQALDIRAAALFLTLFLWQFPHFMAIAWIYREDYARGGYQMLSVVDPTGRRAGVQAVLSAAALIPVSAIPALTSPGWGGPLYLIVATLLGLLQLVVAGMFLLEINRHSARRLLLMSLVYLPVLLVLLMLVPWIR